MSSSETNGEKEHSVSTVVVHECLKVSLAVIVTASYYKQPMFPYYRGTVSVMDSDAVTIISRTASQIAR